MRNSTNGRTAAVVIGGSMAGVLAARVLSEHFDHVTIVERDALPSVPQNRPMTNALQKSAVREVIGRLGGC